VKIFIVDSNVIFSTAFNQNSRIGQFVLSSYEREVSFYAPDYLKKEIEKYIPKLVDKTDQTEEEIRETIQLAYTKITFIADAQIPVQFYMKAAPLVQDIDPDDIVFVALNEYMNELLWTGDMELYHGLRSKGYDKAIRFEDIKQMFDL
jgi:predicted nucleic acid-binding protein